VRVPLTAVVAVVSGIVIPLQGATFYYVVSVEHRLTQLETIISPAYRRGVPADEQRRPVVLAPQSVSTEVQP
jgi:hypothetical protein